MTPFIQTFTGKVVNPLDLKVEDIEILDIAHHLAIQNRFVGALKKPVSIAQHSVYVHRLCIGTAWEREALFHDATETFLGDVTKWVKQSPEMAPYRELEHKASLVINKALFLKEYTEEGPVGTADRLMVRFEMLKLGHKDPHMFRLLNYPRPTIGEITKIGEWTPWSWQKAERIFLEHARLLGYVF